ncbi:hypothetical protein OG548_34225 [Streptomyces sp. NBC_01356]|nr:hypothetical protein [Streptomyces sp. NBC_01356]
MRLGKVLATGVAEEKAHAQDEELQLPEEIQELEASAPEEVPAAR